MTPAPKSSAPHGQRLFGEPERQSVAHVAYIDGASRGNPGPAAYAVVLQGPGGQTQLEIGKYFGRATNNVAEYYALIAALDAAQSRGITRLLIRSDSELLVRQMQGRYKVKSADLKPLHERAQKMARGFGDFAIEHVPREQNSEADALANRALDETSRSSSPRNDAAPLREPLAATAVKAASAPAKKTIRARYSAGALHPLGALDLDEGEIVEIAIKKSARD
jgi:probable phosphoglycerate mutase